jgi:tRNA threonylcarbamoyl adenosine modification protein YeaZ
MPRGLAIETSGRAGSLAIAENGRVLAEEQFSHGLKHAAGIVPIIDRLCAARGWKPADIEEIYVSAGPGSFTGLRVGITVAKTLAFATGARVVAVPSVEVLARNAPPGWRNLIIVLDAKRDQIFTASFENRDGQPVAREPAHLDSLHAMLERTPRPVDPVSREVCSEGRSGGAAERAGDVAGAGVDRCGAWGPPRARGGFRGSHATHAHLHSKAGGRGEVRRAPGKSVARNALKFGWHGHVLTPAALVQWRVRAGARP